MKGERVTRFASQVKSALAIEAQKRQERRMAHEQGHTSIDAIPQDQEITLMVHPEFRECLDTRAFDVTQSQVVGYLTPEAIVRRRLAEAYSPSITHKEDSRLRTD